MYRDRGFEYKAKHIKKLSELPDDKVTARQFIAGRIMYLNGLLKDDKVCKQEKKVIEKMIKVYETLKK